MIFFPKAKINLGLRITGKRSDGYHDIETLFYPVCLCDILEFVVSDQGSDTLVVSGLSTGSNPDENLVSKALAKLREQHTFPFLKIHLHKVIPVGAGLGGGSSDAATLLRALNKRFRLSESTESLKSMALELGSDCPFFIDGTPAFATGRGEILSPAQPFLSGFYLVMLNPGVGINTREAYQNCNPASPSVSLNELAGYPVNEWRDLIANDFEAFAFKKHPLIKEMKDEMYNAGAIFSLMSGSGSTVYGIFRNKPEIPGDLRDYVICEGQL